MYPIFILVSASIVWGFLILSRNGKKIMQDKPRYGSWIVIFSKGHYYDLSSDERFLKLGRFEKYGSRSFMCRVAMKDYELKKYICNHLNVPETYVNISFKKW